MIGYIEYGAITLDLTKVNDVRREVIFSEDGVDYLYTQTTVDVIATLNPKATTYANLIANIPRKGRAFAGITARVLEDYLATPRRTLKMYTYDEGGRKVVYLQSPPSSSPNARGVITTLPSDARNGPVCKVFTIQETHGVRTWIMHLQFTTWINNCYDKTSPIISHRWNRSVNYDDQYRAIATTTGIVVFNVGRLWQANQSPDFYRQQFFHAPPESFAREQVNVSIDSDNCTARYTVIDGERFFNLGSDSAAVKVEASLTTWYGMGSMINAIANAGPAIGAVPPGVGQFAFPGLDMLGPLGMLVGMGRRAWGAVENIGANAVAELPKRYANIKVRAHGARNSPRRKLFELCNAIAFSRLGHPSLWNMANRSEMIVSQQLDDTFVELDFTLRWMDQTIVQMAGIGGPLAALGTIGLYTVVNDAGRGWLGSYFPQTVFGDVDGNDTNEMTFPPGPLAPAGSTPPYPGRPLLSQKRLTTNRPMNTVSAVDVHSRGLGYMKKLLTQALSVGPCSIPPIPGIPQAPAAFADWETAAAGTTVQPLTIPILPPAT